MSAAASRSNTARCLVPGLVIGLDHDNTTGVPELLSPLTADYSLVDRQLFRGDIEVLLFEPS